MAKIFGTDGIRGTTNVFPMTPEMILLTGKAIAKVISKEYSNGRAKIVIGKDTRLSGYMVETALTSGITSMGVDVLLVGPIPTPAIAHLTKSLNADAGIVLSASHNPAGDNGIKIFNKNGFKLDNNVQDEIEELILAEKIKSDHVKGKKIGKAYRIDDAKGRYIEFCKASVRSTSLKKFKIVLDCANGAAYLVGPKIFEELGAEVIVLNNKPDGLNINLNCGALHPENMQKKVIEEKADIGIALDGDADRIIVCDENGNNVDGDHIMAICALYLKEKNLLKKNHVVGTVMSNIGFHEAMKKNGIKVITTKVGDRYVIDEMKKNLYRLGGEQSGHIIFLKYSTTGDGITTGLQLLRVMKRKKKKLSELAKCMKTYPQILINIKVKEKKDIDKMENVKNKIDEVNKKLGEKGRTLIRYSGTENLARVMIEGEGNIKEMAEEIADEIKKEIGEDENE